VVCGKPADRGVVREGGFKPLHEECEDKWPGKL
jgi:hypothetical protein